MAKENYKIMIVAGEPSGDAHAAKLVRAIRKLAPDANFEFFGATSHKLREAGVEEIVNADDFPWSDCLKLPKPYRCSGKIFKN